MSKKGVKRLRNSAKKNAGQTRGQFERDPKGRRGQYTAAGDSAITKK